MKARNSPFVTGLFLVILTIFCSFTKASGQDLNVLRYELKIEPDLPEHSIQGLESIWFKIPTQAKSVTFDCGDLSIEKVSGESVRTFQKKEKQLIIELKERKNQENKITIEYKGKPQKGLLFPKDKNQAYTVYFTSHWMVCRDDPADRARLDLSIKLDQGLDCIASGELLRKEEKEAQWIYHWQQSYESPAYTYGFAIGNFKRAFDSVGSVALHYYSPQRSPEELKKIFRETGNVLTFFEEKSGLPYPQKAYSQVFIGDYYQEMTGFAVFRDSYGDAVLKDSSEMHLSSHELAHQWWGNRITCRTFQHFWLNEAFAVYMATAFHEIAFGPEKYDSDIQLYKKIYEGIRSRGNDKPLVFPDWKSPTRDDRNIVYYKGAYVLHLLRKEMGDSAFWQGIKSYSQKYDGKSVLTKDFQIMMEAASGRSLDAFFQQWVY